MNLTQAANTAERAEAEAVTQAEKGDDVALRYVKSYHLLRIFVGALGLALPWILFLGWRILNGSWDWQGSLSAYYHTGVRDMFVGILMVVGILLWTYKVEIRKMDNHLSTFAGMMIIGVALVPTGVPQGSGARPTTLQNKIDAFGKRQWEALGLDSLPGWLHTDAGLSQILHFTFATLFIGSLVFLCLFFARAELNPQLESFNGDRGRRDPRFWYWVHRWMASIITGSAAFIVITQRFGFWDRYSILIGEVGVLTAFGISWLAKGMDLKILRADTEIANDQQASPGRGKLADGVP